MGFKEGWERGWHVAETIHKVSANFDNAHNPNLDEELLAQGIKQQDINKLAISPTLSPNRIGYTTAGVVFLLTHGTIWNSAEMHTKKPS